MNNDDRRVAVTVHVTLGLLAKLDECAKRRDVSRSRYIAELIETDVGAITATKTTKGAAAIRPRRLGVSCATTQ